MIAGCGGGGETSSVGAKIVGRVVDGYVKGAKVFWDCNLNGVIDADEVAVISGANGIYEIDPRSNSSCRLTALVEAGSVDEDTNTVSLLPYSMMAIDSNSSIISPLTTLAVLSSGGSQQVAADFIRSEMGISLPIDSDYLAQNTEAHVASRKFAKLAAQLLQRSYVADYGYNDGAASKIVSAISLVRDTVRATSIDSIVSRSVDILPDFYDGLNKFLYIDPSLKVKVSRVGLTEAQFSELSNIIADPRVSAHIGSGVVFWERVDSDFMVKIGQSTSKCWIYIVCNRYSSE